MSLIKDSRRYIKDFLNALPMMIKYQIVTKIVLGIILFPIFRQVLKILIQSKGFVSLNSSNFVSFALSIQGILMGVIALGTVLFIFLLEVGGFISISSIAIKKRPEPSFMEIFKYNIRLLPNLLGVGLLFIVLSILIMGPVVGNGMELSFLEHLQIPNFITSVIYANPFYFAIYMVIITILGILSLYWIFAFNFLVIAKQKSKDAFINSMKLMKGNFVRFILKNLIMGIIVVGIYLIYFSVVIGVSFLFVRIFNINPKVREWIGFFIILMIYFSIFVSSFFLMPFQICLVTNIFYDFVAQKEEFRKIESLYADIEPKKKKSLLDRLLSKKKTMGIIFGLMLFGTSFLFFAISHQALPPKNVEIVGHRGGASDKKIENSISAIEKAIEWKADFVEIDIQRTKDGHYILNHDKTFKRLAGVNKTAQEMTLNEIKRLNIAASSKGKLGVVHPNTIEEVLAMSKDKIKIFIELKGVSADPKMVDDIVKIVKKYNMKDQVVLMSLDYSLIEYIEKKYPEMVSGFCFYVSFGDTKDLKGDYLILEEEMASNHLIDSLHANRKKVAVWTVNTEESMDKFIKRDVDAIITDEIPMLKEKIQAEEKKTTSERIIDLLFENIS